MGFAGGLYLFAAANSLNWWENNVIFGKFPKSAIRTDKN